MSGFFSWWSGNRLLRNAGWQLVQTVSATGVELLILLVFAARLPAQQFGRLAIALSAAKIIFLLLEVRIHEYLVPKFVRNQSRHPSTVWAYVRWCRNTEVLLNLIALGLCLLASVVASVRDLAVWPALLAVCGFYTFSGGVGKFSSLGILRCTESVSTAAVHSMASGLSKLGLLAGGFALELPLTTHLLALSLPAAVVSISQMLFANGAVVRRIGPPRNAGALRFSSGRVRQDLRLLASNYGTGLVEIAYREVDLQLVAALSSAIEAGRYRVAKTLGMLTLEALSPIVLVMLPELAHRINEGFGAPLRRFLSRISVVLTGIAVSAALASLLVSWTYFQYFAPVQRDAMAPLLVFLAGFFVTSPFLWSQSFHVASGNPHFYLLSSVVGALGSLLLASFLIPALGAKGGAIAHVVGLVIVASLSMGGVSLTLWRRRSPAWPS